MGRGSNNLFYGALVIKNDADLIEDNYQNNRSKAEEAERLASIEINAAPISPFKDVGEGEIRNRDSVVVGAHQISNPFTSKVNHAISTCADVSKSMEAEGLQQLDQGLTDIHLQKMPTGVETSSFVYSGSISGSWTDPVKIKAHIFSDKSEKIQLLFLMYLYLDKEHQLIKLSESSAITC
jgi:hypothetical protein